MSTASGPKHSHLKYYEARRGWDLVGVQDIWERRSLWWILGMRDLQVRYRQTAVGVAWTILQPLTSMILFATLFGLLGKQPAAEGIPYAAIVLSGLIPWQFFATIVNQSTGSLVNNQGLVSKVYFPRLILPLATVIPALLDLAIGMGLVVIVLMWLGIVPLWPVLLAPVFVLWILLAAVGLGAWLSALNAMYRDFGFVVPFLLQVGFYISPVVYQPSVLIPAKWQWLYFLNPIAGGIEGLRWSLLGSYTAGHQPWFGLAIGLPMLVILSISGLAYFRRVERFVADHI